MILICVLVFLLYYKMRVDEKETMELLLFTRQEELVEGVKLFVGRITTEDINGYNMAEDRGRPINNNQSVFMDMNNTTHRETGRS